MTRDEGGDDNAERALGAALSALSRAHKHASAAIEAISDPQHALARSSDLAAVLRKAYEDASELRNRLAYRIWKAEELSLSALAHRIGVSKARADQIIKAAKTEDE